MEKRILHKKVFDAMLELAVNEDFEREMREMPSEEQLEGEYEPTPEFEAKMQRFLRQHRRKINIRMYSQMAKKIVAGIGIVFILVSAGLLCVKAARVTIFNAILDWKDRYVTIKYDEREKQLNKSEVDMSELYKPKYIPEGFYQYDVAKSGSTITIKYINNEKIKIYFDQKLLSSSGIAAIDSENKNYTEISIGETKAYLFEAKSEDDNTFIIWKNETTSFNLFSNINKDELIKMAESINKEK